MLFIENFKIFLCQFKHLVIVGFKLSVLVR